MLLLIGAGVFLVIRNQVKRIGLRSEAVQLHYANNGQVPLSTVRIKAFYFIPKDAVSRTMDNWQPAYEKALAEVVKFYTLQFHGASSFTVDVHAQPVIGERASSQYDGADTNRGNPHGLLAVRQELVARMQDKASLLYDPSLEQQNTDTYTVIAILYEGVGSSATLLVGNEAQPESDLVSLPDNSWPAFLVSRDYLSNDTYQDYGVTVFAHELGHTFGLKDQYAGPMSQPTSTDLMGSGRFRPLQYTYLSEEAKKSLGLRY